MNLKEVRELEISSGIRGREVTPFKYDQPIYYTIILGSIFVGALYACAPPEKHFLPSPDRTIIYYGKDQVLESRLSTVL